ncbi:MAG: DUF4350 domain-containing protein [Sphingomicrobium sp.]
MSRARLRALGLMIVAGLGAVAIAVWARGRAQPALGERPAAERPALLLLTSLPLLFGDDFSLSATGSPALAALQRRYRIVPISVSSRAELAKGRLLLMAQPLAQPAEHLVALDAWVRGGGRLVLLADPLLVWPSKHAPGDPLRPPPMFADTGLLAHWGLRLDAPEESGPRTGRIGEVEVMTGSPGTLVSTAAGCRVEPGGLAARCRIGRGRVTIIADADFLDVGRPEGLDGPTDRNLAALVGELAQLERK